MKKKLLITTIILISLIFIKCVKNPDINPPKLTVIPDTVQKATKVSPARFIIKGFSNEILYKLKIWTQPDFYKKDSLLPSLSHFLDDMIIINIPDHIQDSLMYNEFFVVFELSDEYSTVREVRKVYVDNPYIDLYKDSTTLCYKKDSAFFFSFATGKLKYHEIENNNFDLVFVYDPNLYTFVLCSPNAPFIRQKIIEFGYSYSENSKNITTIQRTYLKEYEINPKTAFDFTVLEEYIGNNKSLGLGLGNIQNNYVIAFKLMNGRKGFIVVKSLDHINRTIKFNYYVQVSQ